MEEHTLSQPKIMVILVVVFQIFRDGNKPLGFIQISTVESIQIGPQNLFNITMLSTLQL